MKLKQILFLISIVFIFLNFCVCQGKNFTTRNEADSKKTTAMLTKIKKPAIVDNDLTYNAEKIHITDMTEFLNMYTDTELLTVKYLTLNVNDIAQIAGLERLPNLEALNIGTNIIEKMENISHLKKLKCQNLAKNRIKKIEGLENLTNLEDLNISGNQLEDISGLLPLRNMKTINIVNHLKNNRDEKYLEIAHEVKNNNPGMTSFSY